ncbi:hypothetical protein [Nocardioides sp. BYT-33-1]|jgi:hypothetical protein|uniref:hypothetical protein n=1 Tax=Nocardioides sp. BYT-33-1 TaxID=3416952 RepID=UPI003F53D363
MDRNTMKTGPVAMALAALLLAGCGTEREPAPEVSSSKEDPRAGADTKLLESVRNSGNALVTYESPAVLAEKVPVALTGTVAEVVPGRTIVRDTGQVGFKTREETAVVRIRIDHLYRSDLVTQGREFAFVSLDRGSQATDDEGTALGDGPSTITPIDTLRQALPVGTRVLVLARQVHDPRQDGAKELNPAAGRDRGAPLLEGNPAQAFAVEDGTTGRLSGWTSLTYSDAVTAMEQFAS